MSDVIKGDRNMVQAAIQYIEHRKEELCAPKTDARNTHMEPFVNTVIDRKVHSKAPAFTLERLSLPPNLAANDKFQNWIAFDLDRAATTWNPLRSDADTEHHPY